MFHASTKIGFRGLGKWLPTLEIIGAAGGLMRCRDSRMGLDESCGGPLTLSTQTGPGGAHRRALLC